MIQLKVKPKKEKKAKDERVSDTIIGYPCKIVTTVGRIVKIGLKSRKELLLSDKHEMESIIIFSSPWGNVYPPYGTIFFYELDEHDNNKLMNQELEMKQRGETPYSGFLESIDYLKLGRFDNTNFINTTLEINSTTEEPKVIRKGRKK